MLAWTVKSSKNVGFEYWYACSCPSFSKLYSQRKAKVYFWTQTNWHVAADLIERHGENNKDLTGEQFKRCRRAPLPCRCCTGQNPSFITQPSAAAGFAWRCVRTCGADFTTVTVRAGKSEPPAGIPEFNQYGWERKTTGRREEWMRWRGRGEMLNCQKNSLKWGRSPRWPRRAQPARAACNLWLEHLWVLTVVARTRLPMLRETIRYRSEGGEGAVACLAYLVVCSCQESYSLQWY